MLLTDIRLATYMRSCWNWQTGMTKDHVLVGRVGSSPILRMTSERFTAERLWIFFFM